MTRRSLAFRLLCLSAAAATLPALVIAVVLRSVSSRALEASIRETQTEIAQRVAEEVNGEVRQAQRLLAFTARAPGVLSGEGAGSRPLFLNLMRSLPSLQEVMIVSEAGEERVKMTRRGATGQLIRRNVNTREHSISAPFFSGNRLPTILITEPIERPSRGPTAGRQNAVVGKMSFSSLSALMQQTRVGRRGSAFIVNNRGALLAHVDEERVRAHTNVAITPVVQEWLSQPAHPTDLHEYVDEDSGSPVIALAHPIPLLQSAVIVQQPKADVYAPLKQMQSSLIAWTTLWVGVFLALTVLIAWRIQQPLRQLKSAVENIAEGKMDYPLNIQTHDELEDLGKAFSRMRDSLRQLEGLRRDLIHMIVHDLKSPLSSIMVSMDYLLTGHAGAITADQRKFLTLGHRSTREMGMLIQNLLDVAKLEEGKLPLDKELFDPEEWARETIDTFQSVAEAGKKKLLFTTEPELPQVEADKTLLSRVLGNLLSNALRHTPLDTGEVVVALSVRTATQLTVEVRDNGQGIPQEYQTRIFEKFVQVDKGASAPASRQAHLRTGTGLGLTFCKMVVEAHGGRIYVSSAPEEGSTFTFILPLPVSSPLAAPRPEAVLTGSPQ